MHLLNPYEDLVFEAPDDPEPSPVRRGHKPPIRDRMLTMSALANLPEPEPLIEDTIDLGTVTVLAGYWGTLKSFIALDWAASIATGRPWMGRPTTRRRVLYIAGEGAYGIYGRLEAWQHGWRREIGDEAFTLLPDPVHLLNVNDVAELCHVVEEDGYGCVFVDTVSKSIAGADENSAKDMSTVVANLYAIQQSTHGGTVTALHHTGKDKTTVRGSSALEAGVDSVYVTEGSADALTMSRTKRKDGPLVDVHNLRFSPVAGTRSGVIQALPDIGISQSVQQVLNHFRETYSETGATKAQLVDSCGLPKTTAYRAINDLVGSSWLVNTGTDQRPFYKLGGSR